MNSMRDTLESSIMLIAISFFINHLFMNRPWPIHGLIRTIVQPDNRAWSNRFSNMDSDLGFYNSSAFFSLHSVALFFPLKTKKKIFSSDFAGNPSKRWAGTGAGAGATAPTGGAEALPVGSATTTLATATEAAGPSTTAAPTPPPVSSSATSLSTPGLSPFFLHSSLLTPPTPPFTLRCLV